MGFMVPANLDGKAALERLQRALRGHAGEDARLAPVVAILLHDPLVHRDLDEWMRWRFAAFDRASGEALDFFVPVRTTRPRRPGPDGRRAEVERWLSGASGNAAFAISRGWGSVLCELFDLEPDHLPGLFVMHREAEPGEGTPVYIPLRGVSALEADRRFQVVLQQAQALASGLGTGMPLSYALLREGWALPNPADRATGRGRLTTARLLEGSRQPRRTLEATRSMSTLDRWMGCVDPGTRTVLSTAVTTTQLLEQDARSMAVHDWAGVVALLAKALERALGLSLVHAMRQAHGIEMPAWYDLHKPGVELIEGRADLNRGVGLRSDALLGRLPWKAPTLGEAHSAFGACRKAGHLAGAELPPSAERRFLALWQSACELRNPLIHQEIATIEEVRRMVALLDEMAGLDVPEALSTLRSRLAPPALVAAPSRRTPAPRWMVEVALPEGARATIPEDSGLAWSVAPGPAQPTATARLTLLVDGDDAAIEVGDVPLRLSRSNVDAMLMSLAVLLRGLEASPEVGLHLERRRALQRASKADELSPARRRRRRAVSDATETARKRLEAAVGGVASALRRGRAIAATCEAHQEVLSLADADVDAALAMLLEGWASAQWAAEPVARLVEKGALEASLAAHDADTAAAVRERFAQGVRGEEDEALESARRLLSRGGAPDAQDWLVLDELRWLFGATRALRTGDAATLRRYLFGLLARDPVFVDRWTKRLKRTLLARLPPEEEDEVSAALNAAARSAQDDMNASTQALLALVTSAFAKATAPR